MSIETDIQQNTAAVKGLTAALVAHTAALTGAPVKKATTQKKTPEPAPEPEVETPAPAAEPEAETPVTEVETSDPATPEPETEPEKPAFPTDRDAALKQITEVVKNGLAGTGPAKLAKAKEDLTNLRTTFGVTKASELPDDKLEAFHDACVNYFA